MADQSTVRGFLEGLAPLADRVAADGPPWLRELRRAALARFEGRGLPSSRDEAWRTTNIRPIATGRFTAADPASAAGFRLPDGLGLTDGALRLVFVDGRLADHLSDTSSPPAGLWIGSLAQALEQAPDRVRTLMEREPPDGLEPFAALNTALGEDGAVVLVDDGVFVDRPIEIVCASTTAATPTASFPSVWIAIGRGARARLAEVHVGPDEGSYLRVVRGTAQVGDNAVLERARLQVDGAGGFVVTESRFRQGRDSRVEAIGVDLGGRLVRHDATAVLDGEGSHSRLDGLYLLDGEQHVDNHTVLDHAKPHGDSRELFKGILGGRSRAVFNGRIIVRQDAQKTDAKQSNPNLILSDAALAHSRPQLEIYADDVKCTHGATVGRLDEDALFYMRSRGIPRREAMQILIESFAGELLQRVPQDDLRRAAERRVTECLERMG